MRKQVVTSETCRYGGEKVKRDSAKPPGWLSGNLAPRARCPREKTRLAASVTGKSGSPEPRDGGPITPGGFMPRDELWVHVPCGQLRGTTTHGEQTCPCQPGRERWPGWDVSEVAQLCVVCVRGAAGGPLRWSWLACSYCRTLNETLGSRNSRSGFLPLGRHSIMNGVAHRVAGATPASTQLFTDAIMRLAVTWDQLDDWQVREVHQLATAEELPDEVLLDDWTRMFPPGWRASRDAFARLLAQLAEASDQQNEDDF